ncbi:hypothetical protein [Bradyrhizobium sp. CCBAU 53421]|uniref:hypothetical protein n=1 Tax=Bradyrhizobium sp. CCBAU 53421 TaxID=1325120 RepID=UPI001889CDD2|nr:hypothetical protein [Bradyrhizobium sp. CCBAU 53421]QOZ34774.1 hypothetical protein XH92_26480 [Bradyrhizobium sp. CCBAU 53421]
MLSRALSLATVTLLIGCLSAVSAQAQNLEAGKSPSQIFGSTCTACHKSPRGLLKTVPAGSLPGFLRQHYTTSSDMAGVLASFLISNGANDPRYQAKDNPRGAKGRDARQEANQSPEQPAERPSRRQHQGAAPQEGAKETAKPDADGLNPEARPAHRGRRMARPSEAPDGAKPDDGQTPQAAVEGRPSRQKHGRRGKPVEEPKSEETPKGAAGDEPKSQTAVKREDKGEAEKPAKPAGEPDTAKVDAPKIDAPKSNAGSEPAAVRSAPVPQVTPAAPSEPAAAASPAPAAPPVTAAAPPPPPPTTPGSGPPEAPTSK